MRFRLKGIASYSNNSKDIVATVKPADKRRHWTAHLNWISREDPRNNDEVTQTFKAKNEILAQQITFEWVKAYMAQILGCTARDVKIEGASAWKFIPTPKVKE